MSHREELLESTRRQYTRAVSLADPNRFAVWEDFGLTMSQLRVLMILNRYSGHDVRPFGGPPSGFGPQRSPGLWIGSCDRISWSASRMPTTAA